jgi:anti-anti-sigma factor
MAVEQATRLALSGAMNVYDAVETKARLLTGLAESPELELDLSAVEEIDSAGFQLLILAKREANRQGKALRLVSHSAAVRDILDFYNMAAFFGDPVIIPASEHP